MATRKYVIPILTILFLGFTTTGVAQHRVSGTVTDAQTGVTMPGVNVIVKGTLNGASTDTDGEFTIDLESLQDTLIASFIGYTPQTIPINGRTQIDIQLEPAVISGEELVVVGYGKQERESVTGAISTINATELDKTPSVATSGSLVGKIQGITARRSDARPGRATNIQIRNLGNPLFIIDGVPAGAGVFNQLGQNDIANISILKDASAAIYGLRASNGVVLVTTKSGGYEAGTSVNISGYYGVQNFTRFPRPANAYQYVRAKVESAQNLGVSSPYTPEELQKWKQGGGAYKSYDYYDFIMRPNVPQYSINAGVAGGSENVSYYLSFTHLNEEALIPEYLFTRNNIQANIEGKLTSGLKVGTQLSGRIERRATVGVPRWNDYFNPFLSILSMWPIESPYANDNPNYVHQTHNVNINPATYTTDVTGYTVNTWRAFRANLYAQYDFDFGLSVRGTYSYAFKNYLLDGFEYAFDAYKYDEATDTYYSQPGWGSGNTWRARRYYNIEDHFAQIRLNYRHDFGNHSFSAQAAYERSDSYDARQTVIGHPPTNYIRLMSFAYQSQLQHSIGKEALAGYVGRIRYNYKEKYYLSVLSRYDGSYLFEAEDRWGFFPGVTAGWRISEESFFNDHISFVSNLKLRASYGKTGSVDSDSIIPFDYLAGYNYGQGTAILDGEFINGLVPRGLPVTNLSWIENTSINVGVDFGFFDQKLTGSFDVFSNKAEGLPAPRYDVLLPEFVGYELPPENLNSNAVRGLEGSLRYRGSINQEVAFTIGANVTFARMRDLSTYKPRFGNSWDEYRNSIEDRWGYVNWGYQVIGRFQSKEHIANYTVDVDGQGNRTMLPGDFIYKDINGDKVINNLDERPIGYAQKRLPYMNFGINGSFSYKGFQLIYGFAGATMQSFNRNQELRYPFQNNGNSPAYMFEDRWHHIDPFDDSSPWISGEYPAIREGNRSHSNYRHNDFWLTNVSYIRLKNLSLGYTFPKSLIGKVGIDQLKVYIRGTNLFTIDNTHGFGIDPEVGNGNGLVYPQQKFYSFGFNISL